MTFGQTNESVINKLPPSGGLRFEGALCKTFRGPPFLCGARKNLPAPSMRKCCDSNMFRVHQYTKWCQCLNLTFRCTRGTFSVQT